MDSVDKKIKYYVQNNMHINKKITNLKCNTNFESKLKDILETDEFLKNTIYKGNRKIPRYNAVIKIIIYEKKRKKENYILLENLVNKLICEKFYTTQLDKNLTINCPFFLNNECLIPCLCYYAKSYNMTINEAFNVMSKEKHLNESIKSNCVDLSFNVPNMFHCQTYNECKYGIVLTFRNNIKKILPLTQYSEQSYRAGIPKTSNGKYNFISSSCIKNAKIIILTDCLELAISDQALLNKDSEIFFISYSDAWNPIEECDFEILRGKRVYYLLMDNSGLSRDETIRKANHVTNLFHLHDISFKYISLLQPKQPLVTRIDVFNDDDFLIMNLDIFKHTLGINYSLSVPMQYFDKMEISRSLLHPYILPNSVTLILGKSGSGKTLFTMMLAMAIKNNTYAFEGWKKGNLNCNVTYIDMHEHSLKTLRTKKFIENIFSKRTKHKHSIAGVNFIQYGKINDKLLYLQTNHQNITEDSLIILDNFESSNSKYINLLRDIGWTVIVVDGNDFDNKKTESVFRHVKPINEKTPLAEISKNKIFDNVIHIHGSKRNAKDLHFKVKVLSKIAKNQDFKCKVDFTKYTFAKVTSKRKFSEKEKLNLINILKGDISKLIFRDIELARNIWKDGKLAPEKEIAEILKISLSMVKKLKNEAGLSKSRLKYYKPICNDFSNVPSIAIKPNSDTYGMSNIYDHSFLEDKNTDTE